MKLSKMMIAVAALAAGTTAFAAPAANEIVRISSASALKSNFAVALNSLCTQASGVMQEWIAGGNVSTYVCTTAGGLTSGATGTYASNTTDFVKFLGTDFSEVRLNVAGGSFTALQVAAGNGSDNYLNPGLGATVAVGGAANAGVTGGSTVSENTGIGGFSDVEYSGFAKNVKDTIPGLDDAVANLTATNVGVVQGFGVAASDALYGAMFTAQQTAGFIPATCAVTDTAIPACVPSIGKGQMAAIMSNSTTSAGKTLGARFLAAQLPANTELRYVRRVDTSGTQASAQNYFLGIGNMTSALAVVADPSNRVAGVTAAPAGTCNAGDLRGPGFSDSEADTAFVALGQLNLCDRKISNLRVLAAPGTGDVRNELNKATILGGATNYALGVMSIENDQGTYRNTANVSVPTTWKWLRTQGAPVGENAKPGVTGTTNRNTLISGAYDFYYETYSYTKPSTENDTFMAALIAELSGGPALKGLATVGTAANQSPYNRGGRTDTPSAR